MSLLTRFVRFCVSLRYRVHVEGEEVLKKYKDASLLILANHPATIDPVILLSYLHPYAQLQPMAAEKFFSSPFILFFLKKLKALAVPEFEQGNNEYKAYKVKKLTAIIKHELSKKAKILLYPTGHLADSVIEKIGGAGLAFDLKDDARKLIGVVSSGLYGSIFSRYYKGSTDPFLKMLIKGLKIILANGIFFVPKRDVYLRVFEIDDSIKNLKEKLKFNKAIEDELNAHHIPLPEAVGYGVCKSPKKVMQQSTNHKSLDPKLGQELIKIAEKVLEKSVKLTDHLSYDLGMDSLELAEILSIVEQKYHVRIDEFPKTLNELGSLLQETKKVELHKMKALSKRKVLPVSVPPADNLLHAFYNQCINCSSRRLGQDMSLGEITYKKAALIIELLSQKIAEIKGQNIGIVLPSSIMAYLLMFATLKAKKTPIMLNWTSGLSSFDFAVKTLDISNILSSEKFLEKAFNVDLGAHFDKILTLEDLKKRVTNTQKIKGLFKTLNLHSLKRQAKTLFTKDNIAVVLFTSGSESMPKAVPLTHENILSDIEGLLKTNLVKDDDLFLATLPPFHSFGAAVSGFLPIISGLDTVYMPDPTDAIAIAFTICNGKITLFCSAPSFLKQILIYSAEHEMDSLRLVVVGAEKLQDSLRELFKQKCPQATLLEGYGITECGPVVTMQKTPHTLGVGIPLSGIKLLIVDPDSYTPLGYDRVGEILISGKNVFNGYLGIKKDPFVMIDNQKWYRSGDRGKLTHKQELILEGRFKRFIKISAEMISLGALEEALEDYKKAPMDLPQFAIIADKSAEEIVLVTIHTGIDLDDVNHYLRQKGMPKVAKISKVIHLSVIPQLATGKIDYRSLDNANI